MGPSNNKMMIDNLHCVTKSHSRNSDSNPELEPKPEPEIGGLPWATFLRPAAAAVHLMCSGRMI